MLSTTQAFAASIMPAPSPELLRACEPLTDEVQRAITSRDAGDFIGAQRIISAVVARSPNSFRANYILANILFETGRGAEGKQAIEKALNIFPQLNDACRNQTGWYSIYGYAGAEYYSIGDAAQAERLLLEGYKNKAHLFPGSKQALLSNLGLLNFKRGNLKQSERFYTEAVQAGSKRAIEHLATVKALLATQPG
jgi:Flp pilus assembly protein TadD